MFVLNELSKNYEILKKVEYVLRKRFNDLSLSYDIDYLCTTKNILRFSEDTIMLRKTNGSLSASILDRINSEDVFTISNEYGNLLNIYFARDDLSDNKLIYIQLNKDILLDLFVKRLRIYLFLNKEKENNSLIKKIFKKNKECYRDKIEEETEFLKKEYKKISEIIYNISFIFNELFQDSSEVVQFYVYSNFDIKNIHSYLEISNFNDIFFKKDILNQFDLYDLNKNEKSIIDSFLKNTESYNKIYFHSIEDINDLFDYKDDNEVILRNIFYSEHGINSLKEELILNENHYTNKSISSFNKITYYHGKSFLFLLERYKILSSLNEFTLNEKNSHNLKDLLVNDELNIDGDIFMKKFFISKDDYTEIILIEEEEYADLLLDLFSAIKEQDNFLSISKFFFKCNKNSIFYQLNYLAYISLFDKYFETKSFNIEFINKNLISIDYINYRNKFNLITIDFENKKINLEGFYIVEDSCFIDNEIIKEITKLINRLNEFFVDFEISRDIVSKLYDKISYKEENKNSFKLIMKK